LHQQVHSEALMPAEVLAALTVIRRQTAVDATIGAPEKGSLRASRALLRATPLVAQLEFSEHPTPDDLALLAACALAVRRGGSMRNRGRGRIDLLLHEEAPDELDFNQAAAAQFTRERFEDFARCLREAA
jgi:hypothetical protein